MESCGYQGHICQRGKVQFISRYRDQNDYCVSGDRVRIYDNGEVRYGTPAQVAAIRQFELEKYAEYCRWHAEFKARVGGEYLPALAPFEFNASVGKVSV